MLKPLSGLLFAYDKYNYRYEIFRNKLHNGIAIGPDKTGNHSTFLNQSLDQNHTFRNHIIAGDQPVKI